MRITFEVFPSPKLKLEAIPASWALTLTCTTDEIQPVIDLYRQVGSHHTPHLPAALVKSDGHAQALSEIFREKVFLIGGDQAPRGPFDRSAKLIPFFSHCRELGVAGYPEGHPTYSYETLGDEILLEKQALGATYVVTQMCFNPNAIVRWVERIREAGIALPIQCGVAPPINVMKLTRFALRCGVHTSLNFIKKMSTRDVAKMISRYDPRPLMEAVYDVVDGFHIYTFNAIKTTRAWVEDTGWLHELVNAQEETSDKR